MNARDRQRHENPKIMAGSCVTDGRERSIRQTCRRWPLRGIARAATIGCEPVHGYPGVASSATWFTGNITMKDKSEIVSNWLPRYTGVPVAEFGEHVLLTNFGGYLDHFARLT